MVRVAMHHGALAAYFQLVQNANKAWTPQGGKSCLFPLCAGLSLSHTANYSMTHVFISL